MNVARNVMMDPRLVPGGGAAEMALAHVSNLVNKFYRQGMQYENFKYLRCKK